MHLRFIYGFLFQAILSRKLNVPEVLELIKKVEDMSITADSPHVRRECRQVRGKSCDCHMTLIVENGFLRLTIPELKYLREGRADLIPECDYSM